MTRRSQRHRPDGGRPAWLVARVRYQLDLIELCAREVEARGLLTSDVPGLAVAALRRWCEGSDALGDRASWALKPMEHPNAAMLLLLAMVREAVRTRLEGERAVREGRGISRNLLGEPSRGPIGCRGLGADRSATYTLMEVGIDRRRAIVLTQIPDDIAADDPGLAYTRSERAKERAEYVRLLDELARAAFTTKERYAASCDATPETWVDAVMLGFGPPQPKRGGGV